MAALLCSEQPKEMMWSETVNAETEGSAWLSEWLVARLDLCNVMKPRASACPSKRGHSGPLSHAHKVLCKWWDWLPQTSLYLILFQQVENINTAFVSLFSLRFGRGKWSRSHRPLANKIDEEGPKDLSGCSGELSQGCTGRTWAQLPDAVTLNPLF